MEIIKDHGPSYWRTLPHTNPFIIAQTCTIDMAKLLTKLHGRERSELRMRISEATAVREQMRIQGRIGKAIRSILGTQSTCFSYETLQMGDKILTEPTEVHNAVAAHFQDWFSGGTEPLKGIHSTDNWEGIFTDESQFFHHSGSLAVPPHLATIIWNAIRFPLDDNKGHSLRSKITSAMAVDPTFDEFIEAIRSTRSGSAAGPTGASYNMLKCTPTIILKDIYLNMLTLWQSNLIPEWWQWRLLSAIPKVPEANTLNNIRPIMLAESLRKIWTLLILRRIQYHWERSGLLADEQHGFRPGRGTDSAILLIFLPHNI
jgi:hypothetical protein